MKQYGIRVTLPESSTLGMEHLLGENWEYFRWYPAAEERDHAFDEMSSQPSNYRKGDIIQQILHKVDRTEP